MSHTTTPAADLTATGYVFLDLEAGTGSIVADAGTGGAEIDVLDLAELDAALAAHGWARAEGHGFEFADGEVDGHRVVRVAQPATEPVEPSTRGLVELCLMTTRACRWCCERIPAGESTCRAGCDQRFSGPPVEPGTFDLAEVYATAERGAQRTADRGYWFCREEGSCWALSPRLHSVTLRCAGCGNPVALDFE
jgi:hypothetical protein